VPTYLSTHLQRRSALPLEDALSEGRYRTAERVLAEKTPDQVIEEVKSAGLRGRGGAWFPAGTKWSFMPKELKGPSYLVVNADEGEPGTFKDRQIMEKDPHLLLEGILISAYAVRAETTFVYIRGEYLDSYRAMVRALEEARARGLFGRNVFGTGRNIDVVVHRGAGAYICGEETALLNSLEGRRGEPRPKPPFPASHGAFGRPTTVNNVETIANVPVILEKGTAWYRTMGTTQAPGNVLFGVSGPVNRPGLYELPVGTTAREILEKHAGGMKDNRKLKAFIPGGASTGFLPASMLDVPMDPESLKAKGTMMGTGGLIAIPEGVSIVEAARVFSRFFRHETCGQCSPCREGSAWSDRIIGNFTRGQGRRSDLKVLQDIADGSVRKTICVFPEAYAGPMLSAIKHFRAEFEALAKE